MMIFVLFIYYRSTSNSGSIFPHSCQYRQILCVNSRFTSFGISKRHYRIILHDIMYTRLIQLLRMQHTRFRAFSTVVGFCLILTLSVWCFFPLSLLLLLFIALAMVFRCKNISSVDHIRRDSILIEFVLSHICIHYWQGWFFSFSISIWALPFTCAVVRWFRHFTAPLICLIRRNNTQACKCECVCVCAEFRGTISHLKIAPLIF